MAEPIWIRADVVRAIHLRQLAEHGGQTGIRDEGLLESALAGPKNHWVYSKPKPDLAQLAAAYAYGLCNNHPFMGGNKRTAYVVCRTFLGLNDHHIQAPPAKKYRVFMKLADGSLSEEELAQWIRQHMAAV